MLNNFLASDSGWLAFELNILRRLKFNSAALPLGGESILGANLKRWNVQVSTNDFLESERTKSIAFIENNSETLPAEDISAILDDVYIPCHQLENQFLRNRFSETDAVWFDNVRRNIEFLSSDLKISIAMKIAMDVGDYVFSFTEETRELRQPLSEIFQRLAGIEPKPFDNEQINLCKNEPVKDFVANSYTDLMFLRLPPSQNSPLKHKLGATAWREEWIRGNSDFWSDLENAPNGKFGTRIASKTQYLTQLEDLLETASHIPHWTIAYAENNYLDTQQIVETINRIRRVETVYTKDFTELTDSKAVIITA